MHAEFNGERKRTKFTPENIRQITNLVERGKRKEEIAEIIGVTTGTLQVTCSKLGISLRQPRFDTGTGMLRRSRSREATATRAEASSQPISVSQCITNGRDQPLVKQAPMTEAKLSNGGQERRNEGFASVNLAIRMRYKGKEITRELPLTQDMVGRLAVEAEFRGMGTGELIAQLIAKAIDKEMVAVVLD
jgi:hypothetical protein